MNTSFKAELIEMRVNGITVDPFTNSPIVILKGVLDESISLPIWIGILEASAIAAKMENVKFTRPMTHDLIRKLLVKTGGKVCRVEIHDLKENVYYSTILMEDNKGESHLLDARPSDAIAIALRMNASIFVDEKVISKSKNIKQGKVVPNKEETDDDSESLLEMLQELSSDAFGKYKM